MGKEAGECGLVCLGKKEDKWRVGGQTVTQEFCQNNSVGQLSFMGSGSASWFQVNRVLCWKLLWYSWCVPGPWCKCGLPVTRSGQKTATSKHLVDGSDDNLYSSSIVLAWSPPWFRFCFPFSFSNSPPPPNLKSLLMFLVLPRQL